MTKINAQGQAVLAEMALLREADETRAQRVRKIEQLQAPIITAALSTIKTKPLAEALPLLEEQLAFLTDGRAHAVANLISNGQYALDALTQELTRIEAEAKADADAATQVSTPTA